MKISMTIIADSLEEIKNALNLGGAEPEEITSSDVIIDAGETPVPAEPEKTTPAPVREPEPAPVEAPEQYAPDELDEDMRRTVKPEKKPPTMEETRAALNELRKAKGAAVVKGLLRNHSVASFTELDASEYAAVLEEVKSLAAG